MYLPTDLPTIYNVLIAAERKSRDFWMRDEDQDNPVVRNAIAETSGRIWALMDIRDGSYII